MPTSELPPRALEVLSGPQLARRRRITDAVIELVGEAGPDALQMRDVTERSGVALATIYRYFSSKDHLLAAAVADWQGRLTARVLAEMRGGPSPHTPGQRVLRYARRELRAFQRQPHFARLVVSLLSSTDPYASETIARMNAASDAAMTALMPDVPPATARTTQIAVQAVVLAGLLGWVTGRKTWADVLDDLERVAAALLP